MRKRSKWNGRTRRTKKFRGGCIFGLFRSVNVWWYAEDDGNKVDDLVGAFPETRLSLVEFEKIGSGEASGREPKETSTCQGGV